MISKENHARKIGDIHIDKTNPWGFLNGANQGPMDFGSAGGLLFFSYDNFNRFRVGLGQGTKNYAELMPLCLLLRVAWDRVHSL